MEDYENTSLLPGFRCEALPELEDWHPGHEEARYMEDVQMGNKILMGSEFEPWDQFDSLVAGIVKELSEALRREGCDADNQQDHHCRGEFRFYRCCNKACDGMAGYKERMRKRPDAEYEHVRLGLSVYILESLQVLATQLRPNKKVRTGPPADVTNTQAIYPDLGVIHRSRGKENVLDIIIDLFSPNREPLLPQCCDGSKLASAYVHSCGNVTERSTLSFDQRCIAQAVKSALFTRSGYGCLFNHNQAVFLKVCPNVKEERMHTRVAHKVFVSREFKCDGDISAFHGLLALVIHGSEASNDVRRETLKVYFRLLEASESLERGGLVVHHSHGDGRKRRAGEAFKRCESGDAILQEERVGNWRSCIHLPAKRGEKRCARRYVEADLRS